MYFVIDGRLPSLNEYVYAERSSRMKGARLKKQTKKQKNKKIQKTKKLETIKK